jgi:uracil-DNA glycosylase
MTTWNNIINEEKQKEYYQKLELFLEIEYKEKSIYPPKDKIFSAFDLTPYENLKVVILGQDPYHQPNQAQGLAFSTPKNIKNPPSMANILKEVHSDIGISLCDDGDLTPWAKQGVLLINTVLTVEDSAANSHKKKGWEIFTDNIIKYISQYRENVIFILWGAGAIKKTKIIDESKHHILSSPHPSPLSSYRGFFGCQHFSKTNAILKSLNKEEIQW